MRIRPCLYKVLLVQKLSVRKRPYQSLSQPLKRKSMFLQMKDFSGWKKEQEKRQNIIPSRLLRQEEP
ncbi:wsv197 [White spot syndrome virus]|uniref:Wsv197 n=3 Tax=White spot syndrome virus TaxID=342409 RepID=Q8VB11_WSSVS|nr:wsv197 [Shrimp white spot syndrome virus]AFX59574.1 wsv197 [White spot syndrome virus]AAL33201.1 wsv197 [Shrimp white spot syndrome virus]AAL89120.1 WSSV252 [Shrimp white spot syndrome virus]AWQ60371.1 wsv197 [Shrimp white spot syndrome virus]AWQ60784.1 wsv197 [Shrimp white spot syndrome virus]